jgi:hypothetical protein
VESRRAGRMVLYSLTATGLALVETVLPSPARA